MGNIPKHINLKVRYADFTGITRTKELHNSINEPKEILAVIEELWERVDKTKDIRAVGVSLGNFTKQKTRQIALGEDYDINKKAKLQELKANIRDKFGYKVIEETIDSDKEKGKNGKVIRGTYLRI